MVVFVDNGGFGSRNNRESDFGKKSFGDDRGGTLTCALHRSSRFLKHYKQCTLYNAVVY